MGSGPASSAEQATASIRPELVQMGTSRPSLAKLSRPVATQKPAPAGGVQEPKARQLCGLQVPNPAITPC